jgi:hypothetical protein
MDLDEADGVTSRVTVFAAMQKQQRAKAGTGSVANVGLRTLDFEAAGRRFSQGKPI